MINVNELRIGNLVKIKTSNDANYYPIYAIDGMGLKVILGGVRQCEGWKEEKLLKPIPLTEELLLKCGFKRVRMITIEEGDTFVFHNDELGYISKNYALCINNTNDYCRYDSISEIGAKMKYLHQLQNIYFDLTRKELEITL